MQINPFLSPCTKLKYKWIKDLHINPDTLKLIEKNLGKSLEHMGTEGKFTKQNTDSSCSETKNQQMGLHKITKLM